jgi:rfaE bifunctional protein kinase chain/domain
VMLDEFIWGSVRRISPEAPVPVVQLERESFMPGGAANVARNLAALKVSTKLFSIIGRDLAGKKLKQLLSEAKVKSDCLCSGSRITTVKTRIIFHQQQIVRLDRDSVGHSGKRAVCRLMKRLEKSLELADALIVGDYGKGIVTQPLLDWLKEACRAKGVWLSMDPKPAHVLDLSGVSLLTPNPKEAFELAGIFDAARCNDPLKDEDLMRVAETLLNKISPTIAACRAGAQRYFFSSSACVYNTLLQQDPNVRALKESDAYPAMAERGYGWEKLVSEMFCQEYWAERGMKTFVARFHNVYGPHGTWDGSRKGVRCHLQESRRGDRQWQQVNQHMGGWQPPAALPVAIPRIHLSRSPLAGSQARRSMLVYATPTIGSKNSIRSASKGSTLSNEG